MFLFLVVSVSLNFASMFYVLEATKETTVGDTGVLTSVGTDMEVSLGNPGSDHSKEIVAVRIAEKAFPLIAAPVLPLALVPTVLPPASVGAAVGQAYGQLEVLSNAGYALGALAVMTVLSAILGLALPALMPKKYTHYASGPARPYGGASSARAGD